MFKLYKIVHSLLLLISFFFFGIVLAGLFDAGKDQGLAAAAIVLGYGFLAAAVGLIISIILNIKLPKDQIRKSNIFWLLINISFILYFTFNYKKRQSQKLDQKHKTEVPLNK